MAQANGLSKVRHVIAVGSGKGGVGKSTVATNLGFALHKLGHKVGLMDADIYGPSQPGLLGTNTRPTGQDGLIVPVDKSGIKYISMGIMTASSAPVIMRAPMAVKAISQFLTGVLWGDLDYLIIDLPPGTGDIQLSIGQLANLAGVVIVTTPQKLASEIARKGLQMFETLNAPILGVVENMSGFTCEHCHGVTAPFKKGGGRHLAEEMKVPFLGEIPLDPNILMSSDDGLNIQDEKNNHSAEIFLGIARNVVDNLEAAQVESLKIEPEKIEYDGAMVRILWKDGTSSEIDAYTLRAQCPCAMCVDENSGKRIISPQDIPLTIKAEEVRPVGRYGLMIRFSDGHDRGIYRLKELKKITKRPDEKTFDL